MNDWKKTFICSFIAQVFAMLGFSFALPFLPFFIQELGITNEAEQAWWAGVILAATGFSLGIFAPIWGVMADRYGRKKMVIRSMFGGTVVVLLMSFSRNIGDLVICRLLQGALTGTVSASIALVASVTPIKRSGFALGMMQSAVYVGIAAGPLIGGMVADHYGYRMAFRAGAAIIFMAGLLVYFGAHENFIPPQKDEDNTLKFSDLMLNKGFLFAVFILLAVRFANTIVNPSFPMVIKQLVTSPERLNSITGTVMAFGGVAGAVAAGLLGHTGDKIGHARLLVACSIGAAISAIAHAFVQSVFQLTLVHLCFGMAVSGVLPAVNTIIKRTTDQRHMGKAFGISSSISMAGLALGPLFGGFLASQYGIRAPFLAAGVFQVVVAFISTKHRE